MTNKKVFIHAGGPKTGTSALQYFLLKNRKRLLKSGCIYPKHYLDSNNISSGHADLVLDGEIHKKRSDAIMKQINKHPDKDVILSSEIFIFYLKKIYSLFPDAKIIYYLRRPDSLTVSAYAQGIKRHGVKEKFRIEDIERYIPFYRLLETVEDTYTTEQIIYRIYDYSQFKGGSLFADFLSILGIEKDDSFVEPERVINSSYTLSALEFKRLLNAVGDKMQTEIDRHLQKFSDQEEEGKSLGNLIDVNTRRDINRFFEDKNRRIAREFFGLIDKPLFDNDQVKGVEKKKDLYRELSLEEGERIWSFLLNSDRKTFEALAKEVLDASADSVLIQCARDKLIPPLEKVAEVAFIPELLEKIQKRGQLDLAAEYSRSCVEILNISGINFFDKTCEHSSDLGQPTVDARGFININSLDSDPYFKIKDRLPIGGGRVFIIKVEIISTTETIFQCHYQTKEEPFFGKGKFITKKLLKGFNTLFFRIDNPDFNGVIRFDPASMKGLYRLLCIQAKIPGLSFHEIESCIE